MGSIRARMAIRGGVIAALFCFAMSALLLFSIRGHAADYEENRSSGEALHVIHLIKRNRLQPRLPSADALAVQVVNQRGVVIAATANVQGRPPMARFRPDEQSVFASRDVQHPAGLHGRMRVVTYRVYQPSGDWQIYAADRVVPWYVNGYLCLLLLSASTLLSLLVGALTWRTVDRTLAPVDAIRGNLEEITATESGRRVPVPRSKDEIRELAETANDTLDRLDAGLERQRRFTSEASHDLRHPITAARTNLEEALLFPDEADWPEVGRSVLGNLERLQAIVTDLLELARLDAQSRRPSGTLDGPGEEIDLAGLVTADLEERRGGDVRIVPRLERDVRVHGDRLRLSRLLANLLDNAERHAREQIIVTVRTEGDTAIMEVADDGEGVAPANRELVFQRFARLKASRDRDAEGTGLGLPIAREIAAAHKGTLTIEDSRRGARFVLRLPRSAGH